MTKAVFCIANNVNQADRIVERLQESGFENESISILMADRKGHTRQTTFEQSRYATERPLRTVERERPNTFQESTGYNTRPNTFRDSGSAVREYDTETVERETFEGETTGRGVKRRTGIIGTEKHTKAPEGATTGAVTGGIIGGSLGLLAGIGALAIPGLGAFIAAGPIVGALSGSGVGGAIGLLVGSLIGLGIPEYEAKKYESSLKSGGVLICVEVDDNRQAKKAREILEREGAKDIALSEES